MKKLFILLLFIAAPAFGQTLTAITTSSDVNGNPTMQATTTATQPVNLTLAQVKAQLAQAESQLVALQTKVTTFQQIITVMEGPPITQPAANLAAAVAAATANQVTPPSQGR